MPEDVTNNIGEKVWREFVTLQQTLESLDWFYGSARWSNNRWRFLQHNFYDDLAGIPQTYRKIERFVFTNWFKCVWEIKKGQTYFFFCYFDILDYLSDYKYLGEA